MFLTKKTPGSVAGVEFDSEPVDVPDDLAGELLALAPGEFEQAPGAPEPEQPEPEQPKRGAFPAADQPQA